MVVELSPSSTAHEKQGEAVGIAPKTHSSNIIKVDRLVCTLPINVIFFILMHINAPENS